MTSISLNPEKMTPSTVAIFDLMSDGEWHLNQTLIATGAILCATEEREEALKNGHRVRRKAIASGREVTEADLIASGAKDMVRNRLMIAVRGHRLERTKTHHRMLPEVCTAWNTLRPAADRPVIEVPTVTTPTRTKARLSAVPNTTPAEACFTDPVAATTPKPRRTHPADLVFGGMPEAEGWATAPLTLRSRVHFRTENGEVPLDDFRRDLPFGSDVAYDEGTGLYRVDCEHGTGDQVRDFIRDWCEERGLKAKSLRAEHNVRRRNIADLNPDFLSDLCVYYAQYSRGRVNKHKSTLQFHFTDRDDEQQQVFEWILEAVSRFDDTAEVPFGAFLSERISKWVHDLNRSKYGRIASDTELKYQRALQEFTSRHGRKPTEREMADLLGQDLTTFRKNAQVVSTLQGLRNVSTLDAAPDEGEIALPDEERTEDRYEEALKASLLSQVLTVSCDVDPDARGKLSSNPNVLGWATWYETLWGDKNKTELSNGLGTSMRNMNEYAERARLRMETHQSDLSA